MEAVTVACVLRSGGDFTPEWVYALKRGLCRHLSNFQFACLTDIPGIPPVWRVPLEFGWPGFWAKMELFRPGAFDGPVLYLDLDSLPVGDLSAIASYRGAFAMITDVWYPDRGAQSAVMAWTPGPVTEAIWERWIQDPEEHMRRSRGDGEWLNAHTTPDRLQDLYHGQIVSLKHGPHSGRQDQPIDGPPEGARLVVGHGHPRLSHPSAGWAHDLWKSWARPGPVA